MAFWGVEVKSGEPITHSCKKARGRLRISQATLEIGKAVKSSVVRCNVGNRRPVLICVLIPGRVESSYIGLEFEEADDVVFSVTGPRSVYLTGYYVRQNWWSNSHSEIEPHGEDIEYFPTNETSDNNDEYEASFINDDESQGMDEVRPEIDDWKNKKGRSNRRKKRRLVIESDDDDDAISPKKEDDNGFSLSQCQSKRDVKTTACDAGEMDDEAKDDDKCSGETKQKTDPLDISDKLERVRQPSYDEEGTEVNNMQSLDLEKLKKKRKECPLTERIIKIWIDDEDPSVPREYKQHEAEALADLMGVGGDHLMTALEFDSGNGQKSKKRRNELLEGEFTEGTDEKFQNITEDNIVMQGSLHTGSLTEHLPAATGECEQHQKPEETSMEKCGGERHNLQSDDEVMQEVHADRNTDDLPAANGDNKKDQIDSSISTKSELLASDNQPDMMKKKKKKTQGKKDLNLSAIQMLDNQETEDAKIVPIDSDQETEDASTKIVPIDRRTLSNGLTIEVLESGPPGGKVAVPGKRIKIHYTGMLKESGHVYESNEGESAFKFRLGDEGFIAGWTVGIDGMRVGDKRRLIIPPSMGFGYEVRENIPPNSWIIYDIELVRVYR